jgi:thiol-disulfide isomerase/thioredoxin
MRLFSLCLVFLLALTACASAAQEAAQPSTTTEAVLLPATPTQENIVAQAATATVIPAETLPSTPIQEATAQAAPTTASRPAWQTLPLVNARTGETFTFADFAGKTVFVEPMATWCSNCRQQLGTVSSARSQVDVGQVVFVALSVETNLTAGELAAYADRQGFDWLFAVMTPEILGELSGVFGRTITNPPSTPHFIIRPDGSTTDLVTGIATSDQIVAQIVAASGS